MTDVQALLEQRDALERQIAAVALPIVQSAREVLAGQSVTDLVAALQPIRDALPPGESKTQINNVLIVLTEVPKVLEAQEVGLSGLVNPPAPIDPPASPAP